MSQPPIEFSQIGLNGEFNKVAANEYHGPCPHCGGDDRFTVHTDKPFPKWNMWCRQGAGHCGWKGWADQLNDALRTPLTPEMKARYAAERKSKEQRRIKELAAKLAEYTVSERWQALHASMTQDNRHWWRDQGIPDEWQDYLELGYTPNKTCETKEGFITTPAYTIPYFHHSNITHTKEFQTIQYRLVNSPNPADRYRFEAGLSSTYYMADPAMPISDKVILVEGAKKAVVVATLMHVNYTVIAYPSKSTLEKVTEAVKNCGYIRIIPDPDGADLAREYTKEKLSQARIVNLFAKVDDLIIESGMRSMDLLAAMRQAV